MSLHDFQFNGKIYRQVEGGATGIDLTGVITEIYMNYWDKELLKLLRVNLLIKVLYKRYKDDINVIIENVPGNQSTNEDKSGVTMEKKLNKYQKQ